MCDRMRQELGGYFRSFIETVMLFTRLNEKSQIEHSVLLVAFLLRFGDLDGDGRIDILFGQVIHHGPKDRNSELSCLTAVNLDGKVLWQKGKPDSWKNHLTNDVGFQIHDIDGDGVPT